MPIGDADSAMVEVVVVDRGVVVVCCAICQFWLRCGMESVHTIPDARCPVTMAEFVKWVFRLRAGGVSVMEGRERY